MTELHARVDLLEGELSNGLVGAAASLSKRAFSVLTLMRDDGTIGVGEASPLPGYSPDSIEEAGAQLHSLVQAALDVDPLATPFELLERAFESHPVTAPSAQFALETALLDWLGHNRGEPLHRILGGDAPRTAIPIADLVMDSDAAAWPSTAETLLADGATHLKFKIGVDLAREMVALELIRGAYPDVSIRLDGNRRVPLDALRAHASSLQALELELLEEPVPVERWPDVLDLPLPFALDESLRDERAAEALLQSGKIRAVVLKPTVLGGLRASFRWAERAAANGVGYLVSHTFEGPIARAAIAELALALQCELAAGLGAHPGLELWTPCETAAIDGRAIVPHDSPGLGLHFHEDEDA